MAIKVFTISSEAESVRRLGLPTFIGEIPEYLDHYKDDICLRFGNSRSVFDRKDCKKEFKNVINTSKAIRANCEKFESRKKLLAAGVSCPKVYMGNLPAGKFVVRPLEHSAGSQFSVREGPCEINSGEYGSEFLKSKTEVRVWVCGKAALMAKRVPLKDVDDKRGLCRSQWGYSFVYKQVPQDIYNSCQLALKTLNLKFGAFDIILYAGKHFILEGNSSPTIDLVRLERFYKENLLKLMKEEFKENFDKLAERKKLEKEGYKFFSLD